MNKNYGVFGLALQAEKGTPVAPSVTFLASADSPGIDASTSTEAVNLTNGMRDTTVDRYINGSESTAHVTTIATADMLGLLLYATLGRIATAGTEAPYTHDVKMGEELPLLTFTQQVGSSSAALQQLDDCKVSQLTIAASGTTPPSVEMQLAGCKAKWLASSEWSGPAFDITDGYFKTIDAEVLFSLTDGDASEPPASVVLNSINIDINNNTSATSKLGSIEPSLQTEGSATVTVSLEGTTDSTALYRAVKTGSESGTELAKSIVIGALQASFPHTVEDWTLVAKLGAIPWTIEAMNVGVEGGPFDLRLSTDGAISVDGTSIEFLLQNEVASYAAAQGSGE